MPESRSHYQLSFTAKQAMTFFVVCLVALGLSFFFGLMTGLSGRAPGPPRAAEAATAPTPAPERSAERDGAPAAASPSRTRLAAEIAPDTSAPAEAPTAPAVLQAFEDRGPSEPTPAPGKRAPAAPGPGTSVLWIQVASLASRGEAESLAGRLSRRGHRAQIAEAQTPRGRVFRVRVGPFRSEPEAARAAEKLRQAEKISQTWIVREEH